jgi:hypothetical protein
MPERVPAAPVQVTVHSMSLSLWFVECRWRPIVGKRLGGPAAQKACRKLRKPGFFCVLRPFFAAMQHENI